MIIFCYTKLEFNVSNFNNGQNNIPKIQFGAVLSVCSLICMLKNGTVDLMTSFFASQNNRFEQFMSVTIWAIVIMFLFIVIMLNISIHILLLKKTANTLMQSFPLMARQNIESEEVKIQEQISLSKVCRFAMWFSMFYFWTYRPALQTPDTLLDTLLQSINRLYQYLSPLLFIYVVYRHVVGNNINLQRNLSSLMPITQETGIDQ